MESVHHSHSHSHSEAQTTGPIGKAEKLPVGKLHSAQYLVALILAVLLAGLWRLQVLNAENFRSLAEANRVRKVPILAPRGKLFDREGRLLGLNGFHILWLHELLRAAINTAVALPIFFLLDNTRRRE